MSAVKGIDTINIFHTHYQELDKKEFVNIEEGLVENRITDKSEGVHKPTNANAKNTHANAKNEPGCNWFDCVRGVLLLLAGLYVLIYIIIEFVLFVIELVQKMK